jgi:energy-coupling factor transporter transmembrane protein EcfT
MRSETVKPWKPLLSTALLILVIIFLYPVRHAVAGAIINFATYLIWSVNILGMVIPQQILWAFLLVLILYIAIGSFYGKRYKEEKSTENQSPVIGAVEAMAGYIEERHRGIYFKWQIAHLLGKIQLTIQENASRRTSGRIPLPSDRVQAFLDAGVKTSYVDYAPDGFSLKNISTPFDIELEQVVDYLEEQMEIKHE